MSLTLVTGGTGFFGAALAREMARRGMLARFLARNPEAARPRLPPGADIVAGDMLDHASLARAMEGVSRVVHAASLVKLWERDARLFDRVNVEGLASLLRLARERQVARVLYVSSFFALGPSDGTPEADEERTYPADYRPATDYERTKFVAEHIARRAGEDGMPMVIVYPGVVFGPGEPRESNLLGGILLRYFTGKLPGLVGSGERKWCCAYLDDVVAGVLAALQQGENGGRYILGGENRSLKETFALVERWTGLRPPRALSFGAAKTAGALYLLRARLLGLPPEITPGAVEIFRRDWAYSSRRAQAKLGYRITPFEEGLKKTLLWMREAHGLNFTMKEDA